jgi:anthranilate phosphoribosyltransferase
VFDTCGTGGDRSGTFNVSSAAAVVVAACGVKVAKHGNRSVSSRCGSADVFEQLGVNITAAPTVVEQTLRDANIAFFFAPTFHPSMRHAAPIRREMGIRTTFNLLGPLTNPAGTTRQLLGVADDAIAARIAEVAQRLGTERTFVIHGAGVDELPLDDSGVLYHVGPDGIERHAIPASRLGLRVTQTAKLAGGTPADNARTIESVFRGEPGVKRDVVLLNAGAAFLVAGEVENIEGGIERAALTIDAGLATELLARLRAEREAHVPAETTT